MDRQVENALLKRALGYEYDEITTEYGKEIKRVTKQVVPDVTAQIFWLKNRKPDQWRDKQQIEHSGEIKSEKLSDIISQLGGEGLEDSFAGCAQKYIDFINTVRHGVVQTSWRRKRLPVGKQRSAQV